MICLDGPSIDSLNLGNELEILLPQAPECWDYSCVLPHPALLNLFLFTFGSSRV
jgi:hypothetical protein